VHPVTGRKALYLCEGGQMDWLDGPLVGMEPGPHGDGARLLDELMAHLTRPEFIYVHEWDRGDLIVWDNRCLVHAATWFDAARHERLMWRTTVHGNPGVLYAGERKSWIPEPREGGDRRVLSPQTWATLSCGFLSARPSRMTGCGQAPPRRRSS
jgi:taurine dioxygenase